MKKEYKSPTMKVRKIQCSHMLCGSNPDRVGVYYGQSVESTNEETGEGIAW